MVLKYNHIYRTFCRICLFGFLGGAACCPVFKAAALCHNRGWGQWTVMWYGWHAWHSWHSWPDAWPSSQCCCSVSVCMRYWFNPEHSGEAEVSTQQFRHFHPETRTHLCLSVSWGIWFRLSLALPQPAITCSPCTCPHQSISLHSPSRDPPHPLPSHWSQLEIPQHNRFWALSSSPWW